jgi:lipopolysaccharide/colanic/teichoic acid biosynthesis glycosyltransferase
MVGCNRPICRDTTTDKTARLHDVAFSFCVLLLLSSVVVVVVVVVVVFYLFLFIFF